MTDDARPLIVLRRKCWRVERYPEDVARIVRACLDAGYSIDPSTAAEAWSDYCEDTSAAGWFDLPEDDRSIVRAVVDRCNGGRP